MEVLEQCYGLQEPGSDPELVRDLLAVLQIRRKLARAYEVASFSYAKLKAAAGDPVDIAVIGLKLAQILVGMDGDLDRADGLLVESLRLSEAIGDPLQLAEVLVTTAQLRRKRGQLDEDTIELLNRAHSCYEAAEGPDHPNTMYTLKTIQKVRKQQYSSKFGK
jgi:hypothetical protein